jgi:hypothetical protein
MGLSSVVVALISLVTVAYSGNSFVRARQLPPAAGATCNVTIPNGVVAGLSEPKAGSYGNALLSVGPFGLWPDGTVVFKPNGAGFVTHDGALGMKLGGREAFEEDLSRAVVSTGLHLLCD